MPWQSNRRVNSKAGDMGKTPCVETTRRPAAFVIRPHPPRPPAGLRGARRLLLIDRCWNVPYQVAVDADCHLGASSRDSEDHERPVLGIVAVVLDRVRLACTDPKNARILRFQ